MIVQTMLAFVVLGIVYAFYIAAISFIAWMVVDSAKQDKFWWVIIILGLPLLGAAIYYFSEKKHEYAKIPKASASSGWESA